MTWKFASVPHSEESYGTVIQCDWRITERGDPLIHDGFRLMPGRHRRMSTCGPATVESQT